MEPTFAAIKIIHDVKHRPVYYLFTELFRLLGFFIGEETVGERKQNDAVCDEEKCFGSILYIGDPEELNDFSNKNIIMIDPDEYFFPDAVNQINTPENMKNMLKTLAQINEKVSVIGLEFPLDLVQKVLPIYLENNVVKAALQLQYYRLESDIHDYSRQVFSDTLNALERLSYTGKFTWCFLYAKLYCKQKVNLSCYYQENGLFVYDVDVLAKECRKLVDSEPNRSNAWVLLGMIYDVSKEHIKYAVEAYQRAINLDGRCCFSSHIYYWIGRLYELAGDNHEDAQKAYQGAYRLKKKYRNIYKMGKMAAADGAYQKAVSYYEECLDNLEESRQLCMDPLEVSYYFKTSVLACFTCVVYLKDYERAVVFGDRARLFYKEGVTKDFEKLFGSEAVTYREITEKGIRLKKLYECLAIAYRELANGDS